MRVCALAQFLGEYHTPRPLAELRWFRRPARVFSA